MDYSRVKQCNDSQGGSEKLYIFPYLEYSQSQITVVDNYLTLFPFSNIYDIGAFNISFEEDVTESYNQKVSFQVNKLLATDFFKEFVSQDYRIIIKDNNGNYRMIGLFTGLVGKFTKSTGANRADFNGFNLSFDKIGRASCRERV